MGAKPKIAQLINDLRGPQPRRSERSLLMQGGSYRTTLDKTCVEESSYDSEESGKLPHYYYPKQEVVLIDLGGNFGDE